MRLQTILSIAALFLVVLLLTAGSCQEQVVRESVVYETELAFFEKASQEQSRLLQRFVREDCSCSNGKFNTAYCEQVAENLVVVNARMQWHLDMARYNANIIAKRPQKNPPAIPAPESLCPR